MALCALGGLDGGMTPLRWALIPWGPFRVQGYQSATVAPGFRAKPSLPSPAVLKVPDAALSLPILVLRLASSSRSGILPP